MRLLVAIIVSVAVLVHCALATQYVIYVREPLSEQQVSALGSVATTAPPFNASAPSLWQTAEDADQVSLSAALATQFDEVVLAGAALPAGARRRATLGGARTVIVDTLKPVSTQAVASWGLDRVDQRPLPLDGAYAPDRTGAGVTAWIVDTGLEPGHAEFGGRASMAYSTYDPPYDCDGHGTHVAGTVGGATVGVAPQVTLRGVKVLDCRGSGTTLTVAQGLQYVLANRAASRNVVNMSFGYGSRDYVIEAILQDLRAAGVFLVAAAGNEAGSACNHFPGGYESVVAVAASTASDARASYSNYGPCAQLFAPGSSITSARLGGGLVAMSGTSMASPHVAGAAALYLQGAQQPADTVRAFLVSRATTDVISAPLDTPNLLLFVLLDSNPPQPGWDPTTTTTTTTTTTSGGGSPSSAATAIAPLAVAAVSVAVLVLLA